ncbi:hypothetical protein JCM11641_000905 [Rhodosporidiobolus odoratus]
MSVTLQPSSQLAFQRPFTQLVKRTLQVTNHNSQAVIYKVKTTAPKTYCVRPNAGRIESGETVEVQVLLQPMREDPPASAKCRDKFLVQSTVITPDREDLALPELWQAVERDSKNLAEGQPNPIFEQKIRCTYLPAENAEGSMGGIPEETHARLASTNTSHAGDSSFVSSIGTPSSNQPFDSPSSGMSQTASREAPPSPSPSPPSTTLAAKAQDAANAAGSAAANAASSAGAPNLAKAIDDRTPAPATTTTSSSFSTKTVNGNTSGAAGGENAELASLRSELASAKAEISRLKTQLDAAETTAATLRSRGVTTKGVEGEKAGVEASTAVVEMKGAEGVPVQVVAGVAFGVFVVTWLFF